MPSWWTGGGRGPPRQRDGPGSTLLPDPSRRAGGTVERCCFRNRRSSRSGRDLDLAALDLGGVVVDLALHVLEEVTRRGVAHAVVLQVVGDVARLRGAVVDRLDEVVRRDVDPLEGRGQDVLLLVRGLGEVLVGV